MTDLEKYFDSFRRNIVGIDATIETPYGTKKLIYADWIASGRLYQSNSGYPKILGPWLAILILNPQQPVRQ